MECPACKLENLPGADVCEGCGQALTDLSEPVAAMPLEQTIMDDPLSGVKAGPTVMLEPTARVGEAVSRMIEQGVACTLVVDHGRLAGIFTERDVLMKLGADYEAALDRPVHEFMTPNPELLSGRHSIAFALNRMSVGGYRHVPVETPGQPPTVPTLRDLLDYLIERYPPLEA